MARPTTNRDVKDGKADHITREPEQVKAFRDTWRDGIHSSLTYLRDQLTVARDLLTESGSIFVQIGDENVHRVRAVMDEVFGDGNHVATISFQKTVEGFAFFGGRAYTGHRWSAAPARQRLRRSPEMGQDGNRADHRPPAKAGVFFPSGPFPAGSGESHRATAAARFGSAVATTPLWVGAGTTARVASLIASGFPAPRHHQRWSSGRSLTKGRWRRAAGVCGGPRDDAAPPGTAAVLCVP